NHELVDRAPFAEEVVEQRQPIAGAGRGRVVQPGRDQVVDGEPPVVAHAADPGGGDHPGGCETTWIQRSLWHCEQRPRIRLPFDLALIRTTPWSMARAQRSQCGQCSHQSSGAMLMGPNGRDAASAVPGRVGNGRISGILGGPDTLVPWPRAG